MQCKPIVGEYSDVVVTVGWRCNGVEVDSASGREYRGTVYGTTSLQEPSGEFTPYASLTEQQILDWCWQSGVDKDVMESSVQGQISSAMNPPVVQPPLPWVSVANPA